MPEFTTFSVLFFTRKISKNAEKLSIYARITVNGKSAEMSLQRKTSVNEWDSSKGRLRGSSERIKQMNRYLDQVYYQLLETHKRLLEKDNLISAKAVKMRIVFQFFGLSREGIGRILYQCFSGNFFAPTFVHFSGDFGDID